MRKAPAIMFMLLTLAACDDGSKSSTPSLHWVSEMPDQAAAIYFSAGEFTPSRLVATVAARGMEQISGFALRLSYDPEKLRFVEFRPSSSWQVRPHTAAAARDGLVLVGIGREPDAAGLVFDQRNVGTFVFEVLVPDALQLSFISVKSAAFDTNGVPIPGVAFSGGGVVR